MRNYFEDLANFLEARAHPSEVLISRLSAEEQDRVFEPHAAAWFGAAQL